MAALSKHSVAMNDDCTAMVWSNWKIVMLHRAHWMATRNIRIQFIREWWWFFPFYFSNWILNRSIHLAKQKQGIMAFSGVFCVSTVRCPKPLSVTALRDTIQFCLVKLKQTKSLAAAAVTVYLTHAMQSLRSYPHLVQDLCVWLCASCSQIELFANWNWTALVRILLERRGCNFIHKNASKIRIDKYPKKCSVSLWADSNQL